MSLQPLPVPTRLYGGEGVVSYSYRHAARNYSHAGEIETGVRERGIRLGKRRKGQSTPERMDVWRQLSNLHPSAFTTPTKINGDPVSDRRLCLRCTRGNPAIGRLPHVGLVFATQTMDKQLTSDRPAHLRCGAHRRTTLPQPPCRQQGPVRLLRNGTRSRMR